MMIDRLLDQLSQRGLTIRRGEGDTLHLSGPASEKTPEVLAACKAFKPLLLTRFPPPSEANNPENTVHLEGPDDPFVQATPISNPSASRWEKCRKCKADVNPHQLSDQTTWQLSCGVMPSQRDSGCPYRPR